MSKTQRMIALASGVALVGLSLVAEARDSGAAIAKPAPITVAATETFPAATPADAKAAAGQNAAEQIVQSPACGRKVKVVYAGYGEGNRAGCPSQSN